MQSKLEAHGRVRFECDALKKQVQVLEHKVADSHRCEAIKSTKLQAAEAELNSLRPRLCVVESELDQARTAMSQASDDVANSRTALSAAESTVQQLRLELGNVLAEKQSQVGSLVSHCESLERDLKVTRLDLEERTAKLAGFEQANASAIVCSFFFHWIY